MILRVTLDPEVFFNGIEFYNTVLITISIIKDVFF